MSNQGLYSALCRLTSDQYYCDLAGKQPPAPPKATAPAKAPSLAQDNFQGLLAKGQGLGSPSGLKSDLAANGNFLATNSYSVGRVIEAWDSLTQNKLEGASNRDKLRTLQTTLNSSRADRGQPLLTTDGLLGAKTLFAVHEEMNVQRQAILTRAQILQANPDQVKQEEVRGLKVQLTNTATISRAVTPPSTPLAHFEEARAILNGLDTRMQDQPTTAPTAPKPTSKPARDNFSALTSKGTGLGMSVAQSDLGPQGDSLRVDRAPAKQLFEAWNSVTENPLSGDDKAGALQKTLNESRAARGLPPIKQDSLLGATTLFAVHEEMNAQRKTILDRARVLKANPDAVTQEEVRGLRNQLHNTGQISKAVTPLGTKLEHAEEASAILRELTKQ